MIIVELINKDKIKFNKLCKEHNVKSLFAFGSAVTDKFDFEKSDIDLLVFIDEPDPLKMGEKIISLWDNWNFFLKGKLICLPIQIFIILILNKVLMNPKS